VSYARWNLGAWGGSPRNCGGVKTIDIEIDVSCVKYCDEKELYLK